MKLLPQHSLRGRDAEVRRAGFTLLEMLVTAVLSATLMMGLWSLFGTYLRLFSHGQAKVEHSQLVRSLTQQLDDDLQSVNLASIGQRSKTPLRASNNSGFNTGSSDGFNTNSGSITGPGENQFETAAADVVSTGNSTAAGPFFGLQGSERSLRLDVLQTIAPLDVPTDLEFALPDIERSSPDKAPELRSILYTFEEPREVLPADREPPPGLIRREQGWETGMSHLSVAGSAVRSGGTQFGEADQPPSAEFPELTPAELEDAESTGNSVIWIREVVALRFRYFNGTEWTGFWDSRQQGGLPSAVEVIMQVRTGNTDARTGDSRTGRNDAKYESVAAGSEDRSASPEFDEFEFDESQGPVYRHVISLTSPQTTNTGGSPLSDPRDLQPGGGL